ncbi:MAG: hypothetical protein KDK27_02825, partial [Leptospiraceae bacterium]|nr:hypothetical protein [Leptospiraceae bacterium]
MTLVAVTSVSFSNNASLVGILKEIFPDVRINDQGRRLKDKELAYFLQNAQAAIIGTEVLNEDVLAQLPDLRVIAKYGVGLDNVNFNLLKQHDVHLRSTGGVNRRSVSELALTGIIGLARNVFFSGIKLKNGEWCKHGGFELTGKTVGIVGCGNIGEDLLRLLQPFKCNLLINDILDKSDVALEYGA